jgi:tetratricopeptide (TPR) repeat protein
MMKRVNVVIAFALILFMSISSARATDAWQSWANLRWSGLQQFAKGDNESARKTFEKALVEAKKVQPAGVNEVVSTYDLAQVYDAENKRAAAEDYTTRALNLSKTACVGPDRALTTLILGTLAESKYGDNKPDEAEKLEAEANNMANSSTDARTIGAATMAQDGTIKLELRADDGGMVGHASVSYAPNDPKYKETLMHLGPLKPGGSKLIVPWK